MEYQVKTVFLVHEGGTKDYHIVTITDPKTNATVQLRRWGRCGTLGQSKQMKFNNPRPASVYAQKIIDDKTLPNHGYKIAEEKTLKVDASQIGSTVGKYTNGHALESAMLTHLGLDASQGGDISCPDAYEEITEYKEAAMVETVAPSMPDFYGQW